MLVITYSRDARQSLRNICRTHEEIVRRQFGRVALLGETEFAAFQVIRLREKHGEAVQVEQTDPFNEFERVPDPVREAARAYEDRDRAAVPYTAFAAGREFPSPEQMKETEL
nr:hypothetical protein [Halovenus carboxidivorans]